MEKRYDMWKKYRKNIKNVKKSAKTLKKCKKVVDEKQCFGIIYFVHVDNHVNKPKSVMLIGRD